MSLSPLTRVRGAGPEPARFSNSQGALSHNNVDDDENLFAVDSIRILLKFQTRKSEVDAVVVVIVLVVVAVIGNIQTVERKIKAFAT